MKKALSFIVIIILLLAPNAAFAATEFDMGDYEADALMLIDAKTGQVLYESNATERIYPASTTKLMTALLLMEEKGLEGEVTAGVEVNQFGSGSSLMFLKQNETVTVKDLLYGLMLSSGNDAAATIAIYISGSEEAFCDLMNKRAKELGMENTNFNTPCGLFRNQDDVGSVPVEKLGYNHYSTTADMAKLATEVQKWPALVECMNTKTYEASSTNMHEQGEPEWIFKNSNLLLNTPENSPQFGKYIYEGATGMKTGLTQHLKMEDGTQIESYGCLVASAERGDMSLIALIFGDHSLKPDDQSPTSYMRWHLAINLLNYGFDNYAWLDISQYIEPVTLSEQVASYADNDPGNGLLEINSVLEEAPTEKRLVEQSFIDGLTDGSTKIEANVSLTEKLTAPIEQGAELGSVAYTLNGETVARAKLVAARTIYGMGEEQQVSATYDVQDEKPALSSFWWLFIVIPAGAAGVWFLLRMRGTGSRRRRRGYGGYRMRSYSSGWDDDDFSNSPSVGSRAERFDSRSRRHKL